MSTPHPRVIRIRKVPAPWREQKKIRTNNRQPRKRKRTYKKRKPAKKILSLLLITPKHIRVINISKKPKKRKRQSSFFSYPTFSVKKMTETVALIKKLVVTVNTQDFSVYNQLFCGYLRQPIKLSWKNEKEITISGFCVLKQKSCKRTGEITKNDFKIIHAPECIIYKNYFKK